jgi:hypothetical protein
MFSSTQITNIKFVHEEKIGTKTEENWTEDELKSWSESIKPKKSKSTNNNQENWTEEELQAWSKLIKPKKSK